MKNQNTWTLFITFVIILFLKNILFHWDAFHSLLISSLWRDSVSFYKFYTAKLLMPLFIASFLFITKCRWWTIIVALFVDIWCISNLIYFKTYNNFLSVSDILLVGNMNGAWSSITAYFDKYMVFLLLLTVAWSMIYLMISKATLNRQWKTFTISLQIIFFLACINNYFIYNPKFWPNSEINEDSIEEENPVLQYLPFFAAHNTVSTPWSILDKWRISYLRQQSIIAYFNTIFVEHIFSVFKPGEIITLTDEDVEAITPYIYNNTPCYHNSNHLIIILVESFESWPLEHPIENQEITPNLVELKHKEHVLYCSKIKSQVRGGNSGDGQMIINTGLLPIQNGVACMNYGNNIYPNFAQFFTNTVIVNPYPKIWNQDTMSIRYSYKQTIEPIEGEWMDEQVMDNVRLSLQKAEEPTCLLAITLSTHAPFNKVKSKVQTSAPPILNKYMNSLNYTDSCIGSVMDVILNDPLLSQSTIVITGDHIIFQDAMLSELVDYAVAQDLSIATGENYCPLIIYSPQIAGNIQVDEVCYQMDIFPTILHLIGCENYYWHGFGVNLFDESARHNRPILEQEAYRLSDLMIRSDYFRRYMSK